MTVAGQLFMPFRPPPPPPLLDRPLQLFNNLQDFHLLRTLGTGTFGRVRLAKYRDADKFFAMKIMLKTDVVKFKQEKHVMNERWLLAKLNFPFIIRLYAAFQDSRNLYLLLEYAIGGELYSYLRRAGRFSLATTKFYAAEIMMAIEYLHNMDIAYRDLKPENLLLDAKGHIKLSDFGFAKHIHDRTWTLCGTPEYLAPEIIANQGHGKAVDWWALGILIYEMLAGYPPYYDQTPFGTYEKILAGWLAFPSHFDTLSIDLIRRLLQPDPMVRLGNLQGGPQDIRHHPWFAGVDWNGLYRRTIMAPIQPRVQHPGDTGNFDRYPEDTEGAAHSEPEVQEDLFKAF
jgi:serine/threonine protein kinase